MDYEEDDIAYRAAAKKGTGRERKLKEFHPKRDAGGSQRESHPHRFNKHTPLNASRAKILVECANIEFRNIKIQEPPVLKEGQRPSEKY